MANDMRRKDRAIPDSEAKEILAKGEYGVLSTVSPEGQPYGVPLNYSYTGDAIYFHCAVEGHKLANMQANKKVSFCVVGKTEVLPDKFGTKYESVIVFGEAREVDGDEKQQGLVELVKKYSPGFIKEGLEYIEKGGDKTRVYKISTESITGKARR
jgi:nitroimidazol reductase NimA-like FMN-containing flavoprotein (pyridoxamine 5'-phosphate oxidase superfamily)